MEIVKSPMCLIGISEPMITQTHPVPLCDDIESKFPSLGIMREAAAESQISN